METVNHAFLFVGQAEDYFLSAFQYLTELKYYQGSRWRAKKSPCGCSLCFVLVPSRFANFNCFNGKTSAYYYKIFVFQTAIVKGRNRNSYEYKNCTTDLYLGK